MNRVLPVLSVLAAIVALWYLAAVGMNASWVRDQAARAGETVTTGRLLRETKMLERPVMPAPHQVAAGL